MLKFNFDLQSNQCDSYRLDFSEEKQNDHTESQLKNNSAAKQVFLSAVSNTERVLLGPERFPLTYTELIPVYFDRSQKEAGLKKCSTNPVKFNQAFEKGHTLAYRKNENGVFDIFGSIEGIEMMNEALASEEGLKIEGANNESIPVKNFNLIVLSEDQYKQLKNSYLVYLIYLKTLSDIHKKELSKEKKEDEFPNYITNKNIINLKENITEKKLKDLFSSFNLKLEFLSTSENLEILEIFLEVERLKEERIKEKENEKFENKISDRKFYVLSDIIRGVTNDEILKKGIIKTSLIVVEIKKKFNLAPQFSTAILKAPQISGGIMFKSEHEPFDFLSKKPSN